ncbi:MAG TPA: hypothetical protein VGA02_09085 [Gemmatimonadales bacterium]|jgi:hypothetical protein
MVSGTPQPSPAGRGAPSVFGYQVRSEQALRFLRSGGGVEPLEIVTATEPRKRPEIGPLADWVLGGPPQEARATLYRRDRGFEFWATDVGAYHIDPERRQVEIPQSHDAILREQRLWGVPTILCYLHRGDFPLHAAAVEVGAGAVVLAAPSRHGKTTLALAFHVHGHRVLSEDLACCRVAPAPTLLPGPALLRIRADIYDGHPPPGTRLVATRPNRVFLALDDDRKGSSAPVPITAIVFLREAPDGPRLERAPPPQALADLWALNFRLRTDEGRAQSFRHLAQLADAVPMWNLYRPLQRERLEATVARIAGQFGS